jgi:hypothetical protein
VRRGCSSKGGDHGGSTIGLREGDDEALVI